MMTDEATNQAADDAARVDQTAGVADQGNAQTDDIDTSAFDRMPAPADEDEDAQANASPDGEGEDDGAKDSDPDTPSGDDGAESIEIETDDGQKLKVPKALEKHLLRQADYTKKTQEVAETRRQVEEQAKALESERAQQAEAFKSLRADIVRVDTLAAQAEEVTQALAQYRNVDWNAYAAKVEGDPAAQAEYDRHFATYLSLRNREPVITDQLAAAKQDLEAKQTKLSEDQRTQAEQAAAKARQECGAALKAQGWTLERLQENADFAVTHLGISAEDVANATDPRTWLMVDELRASRAQVASLTKQLEQAKATQKHLKDQTAQPAAQVKGSGAKPRDPSKAEGDGLSHSEWRRRREAQVAAKRAAAAAARR